MADFKILKAEPYLIIEFYVLNCYLCSVRLLLYFLFCIWLQKKSLFSNEFLCFVHLLVHRVSRDFQWQRYIIVVPKWSTYKNFQNPLIFLCIFMGNCYRKFEIIARFVSFTVQKYVSKHHKHESSLEIALFKDECG